jgi:hypothetical protein
MSEPEQQGRRGGFTRTIVKKALAPVVASAATAGTAYAIRKGIELWQEKVQPRLEERGGGLAVATETLEALKEKLPLEAVKEKLPVGGDESGSADAEPAHDPEREQERRGREQRRRQRRKSLEQARSS